MPQPLESALAQLRRMLTQGDTLRRAIATGRQRHHQPPWRRVELRPVRVARGSALQVVAYDERQAHTKNHAFGAEAEQAVQTLAEAGFANWHVDTDAQSWQLRVTKSGDALVHCQKHAPGQCSVPQNATDPLAHNREKKRLLPAEDALWHALGMADTAGNIKPTAQAKFRQVDAFLRIIAPLAKRLAGKSGGIDIVDLGCGNAALTFAAYRFLTHHERIDARLTGVDIKSQARERNQALAQALSFDNVTFIEGSIGRARVPRADMVLALHACDTATDEALARAIGWQADVILAAPCCHHHVQTQLRGRTPPAAFRAVMRHGILSERWADVLTDALRAAIVQRRGYRTEVVEFIASRHTPRNTLLRAVRTSDSDTGAPDNAAARDYEALCALWGVQPHLETLLERP